MRVKSGQITPLKMCCRRASKVCGRACTCTGGRFCASRRRRPVSASRPTANTWSRWLWLRKMWSILAISSCVRSPTPVPASTRMSPSTRNDVVRQPAAMEPEQPSTLTWSSAALGRCSWVIEGLPLPAWLCLQPVAKIRNTPSTRCWRGISGLRHRAVHHSLPKWGADEPRCGQALMNCMRVPASSITSPFLKGSPSPETGTPLTLGRKVPSRCEKT